MKHLLVLFIMSCAFFCSFGQKQFVIDPNAEIRSVNGSFNSIRATSSINLYLSQGESEAIAVSASDSKYVNDIKTDISNGELRISFIGDKMRYVKNLKLNVYVSYKTLEQLSASGASDITVAGVLELPMLNIKLSGASGLKGAVKIGNLDAKISGASDLQLKGTVVNFNLESSGASDAKSFDLVAENCNAHLSGASDLSITVTKTISANASGASDVRFKGNAEIKSRDTNGASSLVRVD